MNRETIIRVNGVSKKFLIGAQSGQNLRETITDLFRFKNHTKDLQEFWALREISFEANRNEVVGIIGRNGAGKSTLLKILSRITRPTTGTVEILGRMSSLLEVGTGFHPELSGKENVYLNGAILGMTRKEIRSKMEAIIEYSGVDEFVDTPVKHYSSGMKVRLAFSVAAHLESEVLIIDEVLAVGDAEFQKKCLGTMGQVADSGRTVLFVSHNMGAVSQLCNRAVLMEQGKIVFDGKVADAIQHYSSMQEALMSFERDNLISGQAIQVTKVNVLSETGEVTNSFLHDEPITLRIGFHAIEYLKNMNICISVYNYLNYPIFTSDVPLINYKVGDNQVKIRIPSNTLKAGHYSFLVAVHSPIKGIKAMEFLQYICPITVQDNGSEFSKYDGIWDTGDVFVKCSWDFSS